MTLPLELNDTPVHLPAIADADVPTVPYGGLLRTKRDDRPHAAAHVDFADGTTRELAAQHAIDASTYASLAAAVAAIPTASNVTLLLPPGSYVVSDNLEIPSGSVVRIMRGAQIQPAVDTVTLIRSRIEADPDQQIFAGSGMVGVTLATREIHSAWWGAAETTDATKTTLITALIPNDSIALCSFLDVEAYRTGGDRETGTAGDCALWSRRIGTKMVGAVTGTPAAIASADTIGTDMIDTDLAGGGGADIQIAIDYGEGGVITISGTGAADTDLVWRASLRTTVRTG